MLSPVQIEILEMAARSSGYVYAGVNPDGTPSGRYDALCALNGLGLINVDMALHVWITPAGRAALISHHESLKQENKARDERSRADKAERQKKYFSNAVSFVAQAVAQFIAHFFK